MSLFLKTQNYIRIRNLQSFQNSATILKFKVNLELFIIKPPSTAAKKKSKFFKIHIDKGYAA